MTEFSTRFPEKRSFYDRVLKVAGFLLGDSDKRQAERMKQADLEAGDATTGAFMVEQASRGAIKAVPKIPDSLIRSRVDELSDTSSTVYFKH